MGEHMSKAQEQSPSAWGPNACRAAVSVTFDNLGEAADLERGKWPAGEQPGDHFSVRRTLPRILRVLDEVGIRSTFYVEGINAELYPGALLGIARAGHEVGYHGWRHEYWTHLDPSEEAERLQRGIRRMEALGLRPRGFRPPGGRLNPSTARSLRDLGFTHFSPAGRGTGVCGPLAALPFEWHLTDAYHYLPRFENLRKAATGSTHALPPSHLRETFGSAMRDALREGNHLSLLFHPFLEDPQERFVAMRSVLRELRGLVRAGAVWCAPHRDVASSILCSPGAFRHKTRLDQTKT